MTKVEVKPGKPIPKDQQDPKLPDGYTQLESLEISCKETLFRIIVDNTSININRVNQLLALGKGAITAYGLDPTPKAFAVIIPEDMLSFLSNEEKKTIEPFEDESINIAQKCPQLVRFIDREYAERFFKEGSLRLSSFDKCKQLEDSLRRDIKEGTATLVGEKGEMTYVLEYGVGGNPLLLCASYYMSDPVEIVNIDGGPAGESGIMIINPVGLIYQIIDGLIEKGIHITKVLWGPCHYSDRTIKKQLIEEPMLINEDKNTFNAEAFLSMAQSIGGDDVYFEKDLWFKHEKEWRFIFFCKEHHHDVIDIRISNPLLNCRPFFIDKQ